MLEDKERRCPRLGHEVTFAYCLSCGDAGGPCWKTADCWWESFDVVACLKARYPESMVAELLTARPPSKATSLVALIEQARQRLKE